MFCFFSLLHTTNGYSQDCDCEAYLEAYTIINGTACCVRPVFGSGCIEPIDFQVTFNGNAQPDQDSYCWGNSDPSTGFSELWTLSVTDADGCTAYDASIIGEECVDKCDDCTVQFEVNNCCMFSVAYGCEGAVDYEWTLDGEPFQVPFGNDHGCGDLLPPGNYAVTATDENGCTATNEIVLPNNWCECTPTSGCDLNLSITSDCTLYVCASSGCPAGVNTFYMTKPDGNEIGWSVPFGNKPCRFFDIDLDGEYCVRLVNANGCEYEECITFNGCCELTDVEIVGFHCFAGDEVLIATNPNGGFWDYCGSPYTVDWSDGGTSCSTGCICGETRTVTVTNVITGCQVTDSYTPVKCKDASQFRTSDDKNRSPSILQSSTRMDISPNPSRGIFNIAIASPIGLKGELKVIDSKGQLLKVVQVEGLDTDSLKVVTIDLTDFPGNLFFVNYNNGLESTSKRITKF